VQDLCPNVADEASQETKRPKIRSAATSYSGKITQLNFFGFRSAQFLRVAIPSGFTQFLRVSRNFFSLYHIPNDVPIIERFPIFFSFINEIGQFFVSLDLQTKELQMFFASQKYRSKAENTGNKMTDSLVQFF